MRTLVTVAGLVVLLLAAAPAGAFPGTSVIALSEPGAGEARDPAISHDRRYARLAAYEQDGRIHVVRRADGYTADGSPWEVGSRRVIGEGTRPSLDGTSRVAPHCVAFVSAGDAMLHDLSTGRTRRVATRGNVSEAVVNGLCTRVAFVSDRSGRRQVYVRFLRGTTRVDARMAGRTVLVSASDGGAAGNGDSHSIAFTQNSSTRAVTFASEASNLAGSDTNGLTDVYQRTMVYRDRKMRYDTRLVSEARPGEASGQPASNVDGTVVAYTRTGPGPSQVMQAEVGGTTRLASRNDQGEPGNGPSGAPSLTAGGTWVVFETAASDVAVRSGRRLDDNGLQDIAIFTQVSGERWILGESGDSAPASDPETSPHGNYVVFERGGGVHLIYVGEK